MELHVGIRPLLEWLVFDYSQPGHESVGLKVTSLRAIRWLSVVGHG